ncbi:hypothetical protein [Stieleria varia]|uniref:Uncharacterized protein n=1 Tax=Stieleria varia TaxID=2528005 RepID=A0A5C6B8K7_9BACT|nr:hypothetical protein [Stieleria varia]TWU08423.1 hypothetical protein Pla52n_10060 [Stieleria varia]
MPHPSITEILQADLVRDRQSAIACLKDFGWLLIPDVTVEGVSQGQQGIFHALSLGTDFIVDFATYQMWGRRLVWYLVSIASPQANILSREGSTTEWNRALDQVEQWRQCILVSGPGILPSLNLDEYQTLVGYRIVIGRSRDQTDEEREIIGMHRRNDLRIRSFDWLLEKPEHYTTSEIETLNQIGRAKQAGAE